ncbi:NUDIX hydrolase [Mycolicibacterium porcinum]|nr:NUDIX hydrolase [Mycolicibacterium porcinum]
MDKDPHKDASRKSLEDYPRPSVAVDTAVLTVDPGLGLAVLQVRRPLGPDWALPGTFLHKGEVLADAVRRSLADKANVHGLDPRQLRVFDAPDRDNRGWVLSVAHLAVVPPERVATRSTDITRLVSVEDPGELVYDHDEIIKLAVADVRAHYEASPDPDRLLGETFTLRDLRLVHEAVAGRDLQRDNFRRAMESQLEPTGDFTAGGRGRPAELFRRA